MKLPPKLTLDDAAVALEALPADGSAQMVDAADLREFDSSALALLLEAKRRAQARAQVFEVRDAPVKLKQLAQLYGVAGLLGMA